MKYFVYFCQTLHNDFLLYFQEFNCTNNNKKNLKNGAQNTNLKVFNCCLVKYVGLSMPESTSQCTALPFSRGRLTIPCPEQQASMLKVCHLHAHLFIFVLFEQAEKPERCDWDTVPCNWMWDYFDPIKVKMMLPWKLLVLQSLMGCLAGKASY